jgi:hypothetical protein
VCRNIPTLRGLEPGATDEEIEAGVRQYVRKITRALKTSAVTEEPFERAVAEITALVLSELPPRKQTPRPSSRSAASPAVSSLRRVQFVRRQRKH